MPRYSFVVFNPDTRFEDPHGTELPDDAAAQAFAVRLIRELEEEEGDAWRGWTMEVTQAERLVWQVSFDAIDPNVPRPD
jgi:hypothetical protein